MYVFSKFQNLFNKLLQFANLFLLVQILSVILKTFIMKLKPTIANYLKNKFINMYVIK